MIRNKPIITTDPFSRPNIATILNPAHISSPAPKPLSLSIPNTKTSLDPYSLKPESEREGATELLLRTTTTMSKLALIRSGLRSRSASMHRFLSAEAGSNDTSSDNFFRSAEDGLVYGRITGRGQAVLGKCMLKTDLVHHLEGSDLSFYDIKFDYNRIFFPMSALVQFPSRASYENALKQVKSRGGLFNLAKISRSEWDLKNSYDGKAVVMEGIPQNATLEDIERFLSGCNYDSSSFQFSTRTDKDNDPIRLVAVKFPTQLDASYAFASKNRNFCLNAPISMHILQ